MVERPEEQLRELSPSLKWLVWFGLVGGEQILCPKILYIDHHPSGIISRCYMIDVWDNTFILALDTRLTKYSP